MNSPHVLVVDDDPEIRHVLQTTLEARNYQVHAARGAEEALQKLEHGHFDLVLLDVNMPGINGLEACRAIRDRSDVAIIMLTVNDREDDKVAALDAGADDYITKPFGTPELLARMRAALRRLVSPTDAPPVSRFGDLQLNIRQRRVTVRGQNIRLTPKEFDLLQYLTANPNVPIPHAELLEAVWGPEYRDQVPYLRVFVNQLRKKIECDPSRPALLITEPWIGYRFTSETS
jgi:two-component system, OmpR family, KDP operon response regulator KdpE